MLRKLYETIRFKILQKRGLTDLPVISSSGIASGVLDEREMYPHLFPNYKPEPVPEVTIGSILLWILLKLSVLIPLFWFLAEEYRLYDYWSVGLGIIWLLVAYPAYMQYQRYREQTRILEANALCAKCRHFDETGHFCKLLDEHVSVSYTPCEGERWEGKQPFGQDDEDTIS